MSVSQPSIEDAATELSDEEKEDVHDRIEPRVGVVHETIRLEGEHELHRPASALAWSGLAAGMSMGLSLVATGVLRGALPDRPWRHLIAQLGYTVGFLVVILARQQLFTENTLTPIIPLLHDMTKSKALKVLRLWAIVLASNLAGVAGFAIVAARTSIFRPDTKAAFHAIGMEALEGTALVHGTRGIVAGWLIAMMVWLLTNARESRVAVIVIITYLVGVAQLSHVIAGSVETIYLVAEGTTSFGAFFAQFFLPTLVGNIVGGVTLCAAIGHAQTIADTK